MNLFLACPCDSGKGFLSEITPSWGGNLFNSTPSLGLRSQGIMHYLWTITELCTISDRHKNGYKPTCASLPSGSIEAGRIIAAALHFILLVPVSFLFLGFSSLFWCLLQSLPSSLMGVLGIAIVLYLIVEELEQFWEVDLGAGSGVEVDPRWEDMFCTHWHTTGPRLQGAHDHRMGSVLSLQPYFTDDGSVCSHSNSEERQRVSISNPTRATKT